LLDPKGGEGKSRTITVPRKIQIGRREEKEGGEVGGKGRGQFPSGKKRRERGILLRRKKRQSHRVAEPVSEKGKTQLPGKRKENAAGGKGTLSLRKEKGRLPCPTAKKEM